MPWYANQMYAVPTSALRDFLGGEPALRGRLFALDDLRGVRNGEQLELASQLPIGGLVAVAPIVWGTGHDDDEGDREFLQALAALEARDEDEMFAPGLRWPIVEPAMEVPALLAALYPDGRGPSFARAAAVAGATTTLLYYGLTHGGDFEWEIAWVFTPSSHRLYARRFDDPLFCTVDDVRQDGVKGDVLQLGLRALGMADASAYWAPHVTSFHWRPYHLGWT